MRWRSPVALAMIAACGGGGRTTSTVLVPERTATAGDALLAQLPAGAELLIEIDLARLRANPVVGTVATELLVAPPELVVAAAAPLGDASALAMAAYRVGTPDATTITVVVGGERPAEAIDLGGDRWALSVEGDVAAVLAANDGGPSLAGDDRLLAVRAWAMPAAADAASLRLTARLPTAARAQLAAALGIAAAPAVVSVWGDVADDLAVVVRLADEPAGDRRPEPPWLPAIGVLRDRVAADAALAALGLARPIAGAEIHRDDDGVRVAILIAPGRLRRAVERWRIQRGSPGVVP